MIDIEMLEEAFRKACGRYGMRYEALQREGKRKRKRSGVMST